MASPATRLITLMMLMQRKPNQKAADLAAELGVSVRMLHRYLHMIEELGVPVCSERGPYGGFSLVRGYKMPPLLFTPEEAVALTLGTSLVEEMWGRLYQSAGRGALAKLDAVLPEESRREIAWARRSLVATGMHQAGFEAVAPALETLRKALREQRQVSMNYRGWGRSEDTFRQVSPYVLVHRWGWWYLVGYCHLREGMRTFRVDRMAGLALMAEKYEQPKDFNLQAYLAAEFENQPQVPVRLRFEERQAWRAYDHRDYWGTFDEKPDGSVEVTMNAPDLDYAVQTMLWYGTGVIVLDPPELRRLVAARAEELARQYRDSTPQE